MDKAQVVRLLNEGNRRLFNDYRSKNSDWIPDISLEEITGNLNSANLEGANVCGTDFSGAENLPLAKMGGAKFDEDTKFPPRYTRDNAVYYGAEFVPDSSANMSNTRPLAPQVLFVEAGKPFSARQSLTDIFNDISGLVRVCDPYYGTGTLVGLQALLNCSELRFLTKNPDSIEARTAVLPRAIREFLTEHNNVEFRENSNNDLHDRYILTDSDLVILGHGVKDMGNKDSLIIRIPAQYIEDTVIVMTQVFDQKWASAAPIR